MRRVIPSVLLLLIGTPSWSELPPRTLYDARATMRAERVDLYPGNPERTDLGVLTYLGGVRLIGNEDAFGGFSSMQVQGNHFILLSDGGVFGTLCAASSVTVPLPPHAEKVLRLFAKLIAQ